MADPNHIAVLREGSQAWNQWRKAHPALVPDLSDLVFETGIRPKRDMYDIPELDGFDFSNVNLNRVSVRNVGFYECTFDYAEAVFSDFCFSNFRSCSFVGAKLDVSRIGSAEFIGCNFDNASLAYCTAEETNFSGSSFVGTRLEMMSLVDSDFSRTKIVSARVFGSAVWRVKLTGAHQEGIYVSKDNSRLVVDTIEVAQFIHLLVHNPSIRTLIDTITTKVVLILGRFSPERLRLLRRIKRVLNQRGYVPVLFDFEGPGSRDLTETVSTLAHLARFVVADITDPKCIPMELQAIVPNNPSVPVQPLILTGHKPYAMFEHFEPYPWVLPILEYTPEDGESIGKDAADACERFLSAR